MASFRFVCPLPNGFHARPASHLAEFALRGRATCTLTNERTGATADVRSVLSLIAADIRHGDACLVRLEGEDSAVMSATLQHFVTTQLPAYDLPLPRTLASHDAEALPRALRGAGVSWLRGVAVSRGIARGVVVLADPAPSLRDDTPAGDAREEQRLADRALATVRARVAEARAARQDVEAEILAAHATLLGDAALAAKIEERIGAGRSARQAVVDAGEFFTASFLASDNPYLRERALDLEDVTRQLFDAVLLERTGRSAPTTTLLLPESSVLVAENVTPRQLLAYDRARLGALVLASPGTTSHTVILARAMGIPTVVGVEQATRRLVAGTEVVVDATRGGVVTSCPAAVRSFYDREAATDARRRAALGRTARAPGTTWDGRRIDVGVNITTVDECEPAFAGGADGVGLFRTEMLFLDRAAPPPEEEQAEIYTRAARAAGGRPVIIRTLDVGGDKPLPYLRLPIEENPSLGIRGVRVYAAHAELFRIQLRAIVRASAAGRVWLMAPMIATLDEARWLRMEVAGVQRELAAQQIPFDAAMPVGAMIEVPAAAFVLDHLCTVLDFFSIGTNDLRQYFLAADRNHAGLAALTSVRHPGFLRLLAQIVRAVHAHGKWVGVCGEMAADVAQLPLLVGLGVDEISVACSDVATIKARMAELSSPRCEEALAQALASGRAADVDEMMERALPRMASRPLLDPALVLLDEVHVEKEAVIHALVSALYVAGRTDVPGAIEDAVWAREATYSTALGYGIAIPHCRSDAIRADTIAVLKLRTPVAWDARDGMPVRLVLLLVTRAATADNRHLQVFSQLARKLMHETFRDALVRLDAARDVVAYLSDELALEDQEIGAA